MKVSGTKNQYLGRTRMKSRQRKAKEKNEEKSSDVASLQFPFKLHLMLDNAPLYGYDSIVSWNGENGFKVLKKDAFIEEIAPRYFGFKNIDPFNECSTCGALNVFELVPEKVPMHTKTC